MKMRKTFLAALMLMALTACNEKKEASKNVVTFDEVLTTRRSIRRLRCLEKRSLRGRSP